MAYGRRAPGNIREFSLGLGVPFIIHEPHRPRPPAVRESNANRLSSPLQLGGLRGPTYPRPGAPGAQPLIDSVGATGRTKSCPCRKATVDGIRVDVSTMGSLRAALFAFTSNRSHDLGGRSCAGSSNIDLSSRPRRPLKGAQFVVSSRPSTLRAFPHFVAQRAPASSTEPPADAVAPRRRARHPRSRSQRTHRAAARAARSSDPHRAAPPPTPRQHSRAHARPPRTAHHPRATPLRPCARAARSGSLHLPTRRPARPSAARSRCVRGTRYGCEGWSSGFAVLIRGFDVGRRYARAARITMFFPSHWSLRWMA